MISEQESHPSLRHVEHRPWKLPSKPWRWRQSWCDLLFAHWPCDSQRLRPLVPPELEIDEFDGTSWIGVVPFRMQGVMRRPWPDLPWVSAFPELNVRLYVRHQDRPGVWFLSLDATNWLAVWAARRWFHLPYFLADMAIRQDGGWTRYDHRRRAAEAGVRFRARYRGLGPVLPAAPGTLDHFLTERYCLYAQSRQGTLFYADVHHAPWPLQSAECDIEINQLLSAPGLVVAGKPTCLHYAARIDAIVWSPTRL